MKAPWANILLLILLLVQVVSGYYGFTNGQERFRWILWLHGAGAYALLVLLYWKSNIIFDALRRKKRWTWQRLSFLLLIILLLVTVVLGLAWTFYGPLYFAGFSLVSLHIYIAIPFMVLMLWHSWRMRFIRHVPGALGRRLFIGAVVTGLAGWALWRVADWSRLRLNLPGTDRRFTGSYQIGSFGRHFPTVSWIADRPPPVELNNWRLAIDGAVYRPQSLGYDELAVLATEEVMATLDCTGGWYTTQIWQGVAVAQLLDMAGVDRTAASVTFRSVSGYQRRFSLAEARSYLLALGVAGQTLSHGHGFPARLVAVEQRGVEWVKWVSTIRINTIGKWWQLPLPIQ